MLSRTPAARVTRSHPHGLLRTAVSRSPQTGSQLRRGVASFIAGRPRASIARNAHLSPSSLDSLLKEASYVRGQQWLSGRRHSSSTTPTESDPNAERRDEIYALIDKIDQNDLEITDLLEELDLLDSHEKAVNLEGLDLDTAFSQTIGHRDEETLQARVRLAKQQFGDYLPEGYLNENETQLYVRLYGEPLVLAKDAELELAEDEGLEDRLYQEDGQGGWEEIELDDADSQDEPPLVYDMEAEQPIDETIAMQRTREVAEQLGGEIMLEQFVDDDAESESGPRLHPLTTMGKLTMASSTVFVPQDTVTGPISVILREFSNKHISELAHRKLGGRFLPQSLTTPPLRLQIPQLPIPLEASQRHMTEMEANVFMATLYPGMYASALSVLTEVRKRLGTNWIRNLMFKEDGPHILDSNAGGAGVLAWRDILNAEWEVMAEDNTPTTGPCPIGRSTVVTGSDALRERARVMLENTTFLPRLPDYVHVREKPTLDDARAPQKRKHYDIIFAPHSLMGIEEEYLRKEYVQNLWNLLNPNGGVLILLEKGHQRGFEAIAGARDMLLQRHISSPGSTNYENLTESPDEAAFIEKERGMIVAPCTNHEKCPMFDSPGKAKGREDYCHFQQRYIRPQFLQRIIGAKDRNHEDLKFSYVAVQRGVDRRVEDGIAQGAEATDAAFAGYEDRYGPATEGFPPVNESVESSETETTTEQHPTEVNALSLPRIVYPPMKRRGHVILDICTPSAKIERWTVPRSFSRQAFKDARKAQWGDLWALGAKTRINRTLKIGDKHGEGKKERLARRAAERKERKEEEDEDEESATAASTLPQPPVKKKGQKIPSWKKNADKKTYRRALKLTSTKGN
ncbi:hypothetical protein BO70DRAFT_358447 [Aspergillus heteromorphus CBS 117.55]|uniref:37S ribosomal protein Rsm22 n=1 Tax=Aspergillus heteromorphus CBS 117.55 TaxID=1448321 RepID=A0A317X0A5_9EURO|nr:uncharacterized protein BO70DRAFT_358447 [Aspergillus heteromorphus CBS 117.55]PWY91012.1 hypothetical protein BO70DRAFT_358447 [Aspergillus heteromorphus CBS 117.55]